MFVFAFNNYTQHWLKLITNVCLTIVIIIIITFINI